MQIFLGNGALPPCKTSIRGQPLDPHKRLAIRD